MKTNNCNNGSFLRQLRKESNMTQEILGGFLGVSQTYVSFLENGKYRMTPYIRRKLVELFGTIAKQFKEWSY